MKTRRLKLILNPKREIERDAIQAIKGFEVDKQANSWITQQLVMGYVIYHGYGICDPMIGNIMFDAPEQDSFEKVVSFKHIKNTNLSTTETELIDSLWTISRFVRKFELRKYFLTGYLFQSKQLSVEVPIGKQASKKESENTQSTNDVVERSSIKSMSKGNNNAKHQNLLSGMLG